MKVGLRHYLKGVFALLWLCAITGEIYAPTPSFADASAEYKLKAALLYNFAKGVSFPDKVFTDEFSPLRICIVGKNPFGTVLNKLKSKKANDRRLAVKDYNDDSDEVAIKACQILFISKASQRYIKGVKRILKTKAALIVTEEADKDAGTIDFFINDGKVRFKVDIFQASQVGLKISPTIIQLGKSR